MTTGTPLRVHSSCLRPCAWQDEQIGFFRSHLSFAMRQVSQESWARLRFLLIRGSGGGGGAVDVLGDDMGMVAVDWAEFH